ncbi:hypothetical protein SADUNF_Sadunf12G0027700 [Salix dunnii]|uniref:Retrotransposon Copia-like N-terminal domain-containing protein n=1 Tax=Salix dunnii TaxID=1413687 RepID=A0A835JJ63_9ROSI|nr:hypothetical protein SADUNF_Sadunf12G0027700 [Salix dunnii]
MTTESPSKIESPSPIIHVQTESPGFNAGIILTETNYDTWSQIIEMQIVGCKNWIISLATHLNLMQRIPRIPSGMPKIKRLKAGYSRQ